MDDRTRAERHDDADVEKPDRRKPYRRPTLKEYGTVSKLTQAGASGHPDATGGQKFR